MKGHSLHSYHRYMPPLKNLGDIYICRVAPYDHTIHLEWQETGDAAYSVYCRPMGEGEFVLCGTTSATEFAITDLPEGRDYEFYVTAGDKKSLVRLARTGPVEGVIVNYLHDYRDQDPMKTGLQYSDFIMEDEDILYLTRTGLNEPSSFHNSNYCVFHRLKNFRAISE